MTKVTRDRVRRTSVAVACVLTVMAIGAALAFPGVTSVDRERIELAQSVPYQMLNLVDRQSPEPRHYYVDMRLIVDRVRSGEYLDPPFDEAGISIIEYTRFGGSDVGAYNHHYRTVRAGALRAAPRGGGRDPGAFPSTGRVACRHPGRGRWVLLPVRCAQSFAGGAAEKALLPLQRPLGQGGLRHVDSTGTWLEEYPEDPPSHVLNGAIFTLFGLYDLVKATGNRDAAALFEDSWTTLADNLDRYEADGWVRYQLTEDAWTTATYYGLHVEQLRALAALTGDARFDHRADTWEYPLRHRGWWLATRFGARVLESVR